MRSPRGGERGTRRRITPFWACIPHLFIAPALKKWRKKMLHLDAPSTAGVFDRHERAALIFANKFATDPQSYSDQDFAEFRAAFGEYDQSVLCSHGASIPSASRSA